ncbi:MAG: hypothetical protein IT362_06570 [Deltaproteobacteria bacterium]|nr:hypothetical protein [Deltaproteobacteria bacterium]
MPSRAFKTFLIAVVLLLAGGCAPAHYSVHDAAEQIGSIRTIGIVQPDIKIFELTEDGVAVMNEVSDAAARSSADEIAAFFKGTRLRVKLIEPTLKSRKELQEVRALSKAVHKHLQEFWNPVEKTAPPSLGSLETLADLYGVEAFIFMDGFEVHKREKAPLSKKLATFAVGTLYGPSALPRQNRSRACVSMSDHSGNIIWASFRDESVSLRENFMDRENTRRLIRGLLSRFPR